MTDAPIDPRYLEIFPSWLRTLGEEAQAIGDALAAHTKDGAHDDFARYLTGGLNYIFKSLDLIPDGIDDLGLMDDAFVQRVAAALAAEAGPKGVPVVDRLAEEAKEVKLFLGDESYGRLEAYVKALRKGAARGRTVEDILTEPSTRTAFLAEVTAWAKGFVVPSFNRDIKTLYKLREFLKAKLA